MEGFDLSGGFADVGPLGANRERQLVDLARGNGLRLIGPNAFGVANTDPSIRLSALFMPVEVPVGEVGLLSQSGPLGSALLAVFERAGTGISSFIALGNRADVSVNDLLQYWAADPRTKAIALYLENFGNFGNFTRIARSVAMSKPIVAVAPLDLDRGELVRQAGVVLVSEVGELAAPGASSGDPGASRGQAGCGCLQRFVGGPALCCRLQERRTGSCRACSFPIWRD